MKDIILYSPIYLENWDFRKIDNEGIGGSETAHIILSEEFGKKLQDRFVVSLAPCDKEELGPGNVEWNFLSRVKNYLDSESPQIWLIFRDPAFFDRGNLKQKTNSSFYFIAQDVDYEWTEERLSRVDKYICLCKKHAEYTLEKYPTLKDKVFISSNGIRSNLIRDKIRQNKNPRIPKRMIYSSSPDRGLELILDNFFRITERHPDVKLDVYYGFDNLKKLSNNGDWRDHLYTKLVKKQQELKKWVTFHGRINQNQLYNEMLTSSVFFYPTDFPETSMISIMEMQACGVYPIVNNFWAAGENCFGGVLLDGIPQKDPLCKCSMFKELNNYLEFDDLLGIDVNRSIISEDALDSFSWDRISDQYIEWFKNE